MIRYQKAAQTMIENIFIAATSLQTVITTLVKHRRDAYRSTIAAAHTAAEEDKNTDKHNTAKGKLQHKTYAPPYAAKSPTN